MPLAFKHTNGISSGEVRYYDHHESQEAWKWIPTGF